MIPPNSALEDRVQRALGHLRNKTTDTYSQIRSFTPSGYTDPELAHRERELIFGTVPSIVAHGSEIPNPNDFITLQMPRNKVLVVRQRDGGVRSFVNICRHRGALLEPRASGSCRLFSCGYHRWSYDPDGALRAITRENTFGDMDRSQHGLIELPTEERHGFIWIVDAAEAKIDVAAWLGPEMDETLRGYRMDELTCFRAEGYDEPTNWKIMQDAFIDVYHLQYAHPNTAGKAIHTNVMTVEDFGRHCRFAALRKTIDRWLAEDPGNANLAAHVTDNHLLLPNSTLIRQRDHCELLTFRPDPAEPGRSRMEMRLLVPRAEDTELDNDAWHALWEKNWKILLTVLHGEDFPLLRGSQSAMESRSAGPLVLGRNETVNHIFHREIARLLEAGGWQA
ncbi:aromatic ring-hydroxylating dioxygenase subunit alpha [Amycolatopsis sp. K13G38]|uniref:Aromatic ring-hydroxylating dioxygenase subunit alpha n=2 Tax=Amycolatopsis acididurans TaxID=2724524 RepID=A0ABX1J8G3_9PSEU|nr:aromatic ring-hydroxylating dioxygenase subunit alpha [Amycolatopsis acididurans]